MIKPPVVTPTDEVTVVSRLFGTPLVVKGLTWLPLTELAFWGVMAWWAGVRRPARTWLQRLGVGALTMPVALGSEWCHNLAHAAAARWVGVPMDALRITWGMPLIVYYDLEDPSVTPRQHILRALGGPLFNAIALSLALLARGLARPDSLPREVADVAAGTNALLLSAGLLPLPALDGGSLLKWSFVESGLTPPQADRLVQKVDGAVGVGLGAAAALSFKKRRRALGAFLGLLSALALGFALGWVKEKE